MVQQISLGIDIGTTSVKVCVYDPVENKVLAKQSKDTQANVPSDQGCEGNKQDVPKIISALHSCMSRLPKDLLRQIKVIGVCGQMHGVTFWQHTHDSPPWDRIETTGAQPGVKFEVIREKVSNLYTWQDSRCNASFLSSLPSPESHVKPSTGYGCSTLFWFARNRPEKLAKYNCCATVQDFAVALLCNLAKPVMTHQNAASWGYFNSSTGEWNTNILSGASFPVELLPTIVKPRTVAGHLPESWFGIPAGTPVGAALGDFQCSVIATLTAANQAALNISTSAQLAFLMPNSFEPVPTPQDEEINYFPYFDNRYLAVAASLNGGNALATFVQMLQQWTLQLGFSVPQSKVWEKITELGNRDDAASNLEITPTLLGERHAPEQNASVNNLDPGNLALGQVFQALCKGIVQNIVKMLPKEKLAAANIVEIVGSGSALTRNVVLQKQVAQLYDLPINFVSGRGACFGAALAVSNYT